MKVQFCYSSHPSDQSCATAAALIGTCQSVCDLGLLSITLPPWPAHKPFGHLMMFYPANILMAEDQETDAFLLKWAFEKAGLEHHFTHVLDGQQAIEYLSGSGVFCDRLQHPYPDLLLLDLKMPRLTGFDVLEWLQAHQPSSKMPVVVLSSSDLGGDVEKARSLGAADYVVKPTGLDQMVKLARQLQERWLQTDAMQLRETRPSEG